MNKTIAALMALALASGSAVAQQAASPTASPAADAGLVAKFKLADKNSNGTLDGAELDSHKASLVKIDTDKDGKISQAEFVAGSKAGLIK